MPTNDLKCILNEEYQNKMRAIREKLEELNTLIAETEEHLPALCDTKTLLKETMDSLSNAEEYYGTK